MIVLQVCDILHHYSKAKPLTDLIWKDKILGPIEKGDQEGRQATKRKGIRLLHPLYSLAFSGKGTSINLGAQGTTLAAVVQDSSASTSRS